MPSGIGGPEEPRGRDAKRKGTSAAGRAAAPGGRAPSATSDRPPRQATGILAGAGSAPRSVVASRRGRFGDRDNRAAGCACRNPAVGRRRSGWPGSRLAGSARRWRRAIDDVPFEARGEPVLAPSPSPSTSPAPGDVAVMDDPGGHGGRRVGDPIESAGATAIVRPPDGPDCTRSRSPSRRSGRSRGAPRRARSATPIGDVRDRVVPARRVVDASRASRAPASRGLSRRPSGPWKGASVSHPCA